MLPYILRPHTNEDENFIYDTFLKIYREVDPNNFIPADNYFSNQRSVIKSLLSKSKVLIATDIENIDYIYGYIIYDFVKDFLVLHWLHIKKPFRNQGIANDIIKTLYPRTKSDIIVCTHKSRVFKQLKDRYKLQYDPYKDVS